MLEERCNALCEELARKRILERKKNRQTQVPYDDEAITLNFGTTRQWLARENKHTLQK
jgi:hypothetical protein